MPSRSRWWSVVGGFACFGLFTAMPPVTSFLFAAVGILTFIGCPATILLLVHRTWQLNWKFFAFAGPVDAILYGAYGALLVHLAKEL